jgi:hypothetical protein
VCAEGWVMEFGELESIGWVSMQLYGEGERLSLTCIPGHSHAQMDTERDCNSHNK